MNQTLIIGKKDAEELLTMEACICAMEETFRDISAGKTAMLQRSMMPQKKGNMFALMASDNQQQEICGVKTIVFPGAEAKKNGTTRATACINKAMTLDRPLIFAIGNAPTALVRIYELVSEGKLKPELVIGVPVGFVNVVQSKELIMTAAVPYIVARGRKGGSNIAAAICNGILYQM